MKMILEISALNVVLKSDNFLFIIQNYNYRIIYKIGKFKNQGEEYF